MYKKIKDNILPSDSVRLSTSSFCTCMSCKTSGRLVTMPVPRGRKSLPTILSNTELFPELWEDVKQHDL